MLIINRSPARDKKNNKKHEIIYIWVSPSLHNLSVQEENSGSGFCLGDSALPSLWLYKIHRYITVKAQYFRNI